MSCRRRALLAAALLLAMSAPSDARAQNSKRKIAGVLERAMTSEAYRRVRAPNASRTSLPVTIRMQSVAAMVALRDKAPAGLVIRSWLGEVLIARASPEALRSLRADPDIVRIELDAPPQRVAPIAQTASEIQAPFVWRGAAGGFTGQGVLVADIDTGIDVFHPAFFRSSENYYAWLDLDGDQIFRPGIDAIDLDADGFAAPGESLGFLDRRLFVDSSFLPIAESGNDRFDLGDTLYVDANQNGTRDYGASAGFDDADATLGEVLLLVDDVNGNGQLDVGEKLVTQAQSKIRAVFDGQTEYRRGENLSAAPGREGYFENHGTQVAGTILGGDLQHGDMVGIAPNAELVVAVYDLSQNFSELLAWAVAQGADVILHEYAPWTGYHLDGSSNYEHMLDAAAAQGILHVNPVGNLGGSSKHARAALAPQSSQNIAFRIPGIGTERIEMTILWREPERLLNFRLDTPGGQNIDLGSASTEVALPGGGTLISLRDDSLGGTAMFHMVILGPTQIGDWQLQVQDLGATELSQEPAQLSMYVSDDRSGWGNGVRFLDFVSEEHLVGFPSTSDSALGVAAYVGHGEFPINSSTESSGEFRSYSGRGTRIDGQAVIAIAAPDNPLVATNEREFNSSLGTQLGDMAAFSGTSGAGAHVAGAAALMREANPDLNMATFREALAMGAQVDDQVVGSPSHTVAQLWGAGKLRIYRSIVGSDPQANSPPLLSVHEACALPGQFVPLGIALTDVDEPSGSLLVQFDDDYDGQWDAPAAPLDSHMLGATSLGVHYSKMRALDSQGASRQALVVLSVQTECDAGSGESDAGPYQIPSYAGDCGCQVGGGWDTDYRVILALLAWLGAWRLSLRQGRNRRL